MTAEIRQEANGTLTISSQIVVPVLNSIVHVTCLSEHPHYQSGSEHKATTQLRDYSLPQPIVSPKKLDNLRAGQTVFVECRIPDVNVYARPSLIWTLPDGFERQQVVIENGFIINRMSLIIDKAMNEKTLQCRSELAYARSLPTELKMAVAFAPSKPTLTIQLPAEKNGEIGINDLKQVKVTCGNVEANPQAIVRLLINGAEVPLPDMPLTNQELQLIPADTEIPQKIVDSVRGSGRQTTVSCIAYNFIGSGASESVLMPVYATPSNVRMAPVNMFARDPVRGIYSFRSGTNATFFCDMTGGELSQNAMAMWTLKCPSYEEDQSSQSPEELVSMARMVNKFTTNTTIEIDPADPQHARSYMSKIVTESEDECQILCQAVDPIAGISDPNTPVSTLEIFCKII